MQGCWYLLILCFSSSFPFPCCAVPVHSQATVTCEGFGAGGLAFQLGCASERGSDDDDDGVDDDLITVRWLNGTETRHQ